VTDEGWGFSNIELYLDDATCPHPAALGLEERDIPDSKMSASSEYDQDTAAKLGRLHTEGNSWTAKENDASQYLEVQFARATTVSAVSTQGRENSDNWVKSYSLSYSTDGETWEQYTENEQVKEFVANDDRNTVVTHSLMAPRPVATFMRIVPITWHGHIAMRAELYGCLMSMEQFKEQERAKREFETLQAQEALAAKRSADQEAKVLAEAALAMATEEHDEAETIENDAKSEFTLAETAAAEAKTKLTQDTNAHTITSDELKSATQSHAQSVDATATAQEA
jgi:hypothetical protein